MGVDPEVGRGHNLPCKVRTSAPPSRKWESCLLTGKQGSLLHDPGLRTIQMLSGCLNDQPRCPNPKSQIPTSSQSGP